MDGRRPSRFKTLFEQAKLTCTTSVRAVKNVLSRNVRRRSRPTGNTNSISNKSETKSSSKSEPSMPDRNPNQKIIFHTRTHQLPYRGQPMTGHLFLAHSVVLSIITNCNIEDSDQIPHPVRLQNSIFSSMAASPELSISKTLLKAISTVGRDGSSEFTFLGMNNGMITGVCAGENKLAVIRAGSTVFQSPRNMHGFKQPVTSFDIFNGLGEMKQFEFLLDEGDVIVFATAGFWDNVDIEKVEEVVERSIRACVDSGNDMESTRSSARRINVVFRRVVAELTKIAKAGMADKTWNSPFAEDAADNYIEEHGGRPDSFSLVLAILIDENTRDVPAVWSLASLDMRTPGLFI